MTVSTEETKFQSEGMAAEAVAMEENGSSAPSLVALAADALTVVRSFMQLALLEVGLATQALPRIIGLAVVGIFLTLFAWLSFSAVVGWLAYSFLGSAGWGIFGFLVLQMLALIVCKLLYDMYVRRLSLPNTRNFIKRTGESLHDAIHRS